MGITDKIGKYLYVLIAIALVAFILNNSGSIINSIFECGRSLGNALGDLLFK